MFAACTAPAVSALAAAGPATSTGLQHPAPQGLGVKVQAIFLGQMFGRQGRPETFLQRAGILAAHQLQNFFAESAGLGALRRSPGVAVLQTLRPALPESFPQTLGLAIAEPQNFRSIQQPQ